MDDNNIKTKTVQIDDSQAEDKYANFTIVGSTEYEFVLEFISIFPPSLKPKLFNRIIMNPKAAKVLSYHLTEHVANYEKRYGTINIEKKNIDSKDPTRFN